MLRWVGIVWLAIGLLGAAHAKPPIEAFGEAEAIRSLEISPDGKSVAFLQRLDDKDFLVKVDLATSKAESLLRVDQIRARHVRWVGNDFVVMTVSDTRSEFGYRGRWEMSAGFAYSLKSRKYVQLLRDTPDLYPAQSGLGFIEAVDPSGQYVYMPAWVGVTSNGPTRDLLKVDLESGRGLRVGGKKGTQSTRDWVVNDKGDIIGREDYSEKTGEYRILANATGDTLKEIFSTKDPDEMVSLLGTSAKSGNLLVSVESASGETGYYAVHEMAIADGAVGERLFARDGTDVEGLIQTGNGVIHGVVYAGMYPTYQMLDPALDTDIRAIQAKFPGAAVYLSSWSDDWSRLIFYISGDLDGPRYQLFDRSSRSLRLLARSRPDIKTEFVAEVSVIEYRARDDLKIPGLITWPVGVPADQRKNLPAVVMPHGGPQAYDAVQYDWLAQFLANEGYLVLQPNFRGSDGFGKAFREAGHGEWGGKMQDDITDGVKALSRMGWIDPQRVCIMGWSYGGYSALAGGALTPDLYRCVVAIAGVSDLRGMLNKTRMDQGERSSAFRYWKMHIGDPDRDREKIDAASPARLADRFKAPVFLAHGTDDTIVPASQSDQMETALKRAGKTVTYLKIKGDDHSLVDNESRRNVLTQLSGFLAANLTPKP